MGEIGFTSDSVKIPSLTLPLSCTHMHLREKNGTIVYIAKNKPIRNKRH